MNKYFHKNKYFIYTGLLCLLFILNIFLLNVYVTEFYKLFSFNTKKTYVYSDGNFSARLKNALIDSFERKFKKLKFKVGMQKQTDFKYDNFYLFYSQTAKNKLEENLPDTATSKYEKGFLHYNSKINEVDFRYRGDFNYHFMFDKKSIRIKTKKDSLYNNIRKFNIIAPKFQYQLNNILSYQVAKDLDMLTPDQYPVRLYINNSYNGLHYFLEQVDESFLRNRFLMPGDIYAGEMVGFKDAYKGLHQNINPTFRELFSSSDFWHKNAINNHYHTENKKPLQKLLFLINNNSYESKKELSKMIDLDSWATFSIFQSLLTTYHFDRYHNWKLFYDPWKQKFQPIVWDPAGWAWSLNVSKKDIHPILHLKIEQELFRNGDFLEIYYKKLNTLIETGLLEKINNNINKTINNHISEIKYDPNLKPSNIEIVNQSIFKLKSNIKDLFDDFKKKHITSLDNKIFFTQNAEDSIIISGINKNSYNKFEIEFSGNTDISNLNNIVIKHQYSVYGEKIVKKTIIPVKKINKNKILFDFNFLPNFKISQKYIEKTHSAQFKTKELNHTSSFLTIQFNQEIKVKNINLFGTHNKSLSLIEKKKLDYGDESFFFTAPNSNLKSIQKILSGELIFDKNVTFNQRVIISPGTIIKLKKNVSLFFNDSLIAKGSLENPIKIISDNENLGPWGTFGLQNSKSVFLDYVYFDGGSGYKDMTKEYSAMLSIHNVKNFTIKNCKLSNSYIVDDMLHVVYSNGTITDTEFKNSHADAIDIDISKVTFKGIKVTNSGNDGLDLMSSAVKVSNSFISTSIDKGISVGEKSYLSVYNSHIENNFKGIEVKDGSKSIIDNVKIINNDTDISAYKKNWRYNAPGYIYLIDSELNFKNISLIDGSQIFVDKEIEKQKNIYVINNFNHIESLKKIKNYDLKENELQKFMEFVDTRTTIFEKNDSRKN